ncbi:hypothetical protein JCM4814A_15930 [Streptomyces phaeofaciens JCM 4814]|uniref:Cellulose 1,4-beta-cellobiosidase n=1 Tax=Streptomyces phaeofaciens TaxID=68254 RepID=A0A918LTP0_9ACTN|nr:PA14 domain-containing protein [Streptomyces phaeofaciens]GGT48261.1 hypothetical protein GCM10010226_26710 [Streptomyces phaeofaciens]
MKPARLATAVVLATTGGLLTAAAAPASAATTCTSPVYKRQFYANTTFSGTPKKTDCDSTVSESWGAKAPASGLPTNDFGVRWSVTRDFGSGGPFSFAVAAQDGIRVYLDGVRKVDVWKNVSSTVSKTVNVTVPKGKHTLRVDYVNWTGNAGITFTYTPRTTAGVDTVPPLAPTGGSVAYDRATGRAGLSWARNKEMDLAGYRVYRRPAESTAWTRVVTTGATTYTDTPPATGQSYVYEIRAHDKAGNESAGGTDLGPLTTADRTPPAVPSGVALTDGQPGVSVSWKQVPGAAHYLVHRRWDTDGGDEPVVQVASVTDGTSWLDTTAQERLAYSYWVTAVDAPGNRSARSATVSVERGDHAPSAPLSLTASPEDGEGIALTWRAATTPVTRDLAHFRIYRDGRFVEEVPAKQTSFTDTAKVRHGATYTYTVTAVDTQAQESAASSPATATAPATGLAPAAVTGLRGYMDGTDIVLVWESNTEPDVRGYDVYRAVLVDGVWRYELWDDVQQPYSDDEPVSYVHEIYEPQGETVRWAVSAVDDAGNSRSPGSEDVSYVTVTEPGSPENS